jgi:hypothetical protein
VTCVSTGSGPFETEREVLESPTVQAIYAELGRTPVPGELTAANLKMLLDAVSIAAVSVGAYDVDVLEWLAGHDPQVCAVIASLITRASEVG